MIERRGLALINPHLKINRVAIDISLHGIEIVKDITIIVVLVAYSIFVLIETFLQKSLIIYVAVLHFQGAGERFRAINGISHPVHVSQIILLPFFEVYINIYVLFIKRNNAVAFNYSIAIAPFVVFVYYETFVFLRAETFWHETSLRVCLPRGFSSSLS